MKKSLYGISMVVYIISLVMALERGAPFFLGYMFWGSLAGSDDYATGLTVVLIIIAMLFHTLAVFKNKKFIYVTRAILFLGGFLNVLLLFVRVDMVLLLITPIIMLVLTFIEKTEYIVTNTVSEEELATIKKEISDEKTNSAIGNVVAFFVLPIILVIGIMVCSIPFSIKYVNELKEEYRSYYADNMATEKQNAQFKDISYTQIAHPWQANINHTTARIETKGYDDYWIINDNINIVLNLYYDTWDSGADDEILVNVNYSYPDMQNDKISKIYMGDGYDFDVKNPETYICLDFTDEEKEILRDFILNEKYSEQERIELTQQQYQDAEMKVVFWYFEGEDTLYLEEGYTFKAEDGKYYLFIGWLSGDCYPLPEEICERLEKVW